MSESKKQGFFSKLFSSSKDKDNEKKFSKFSSNNSSPAPSSPSSPPPLYSTSHPPTPVKASHQPKKASRKTNLSRKRPHKNLNDYKVDLSKPLEFPCTPELILAYHKKKPFLSSNEEWLVVELNEYECLVESLDIVRMIADHSKFFEVEPDDLWEEFFEFVEDQPIYDEIINLDIFREFRDQKYPC